MELRGYGPKIAMLVGPVIGLALWDWQLIGLLPGVAIGVAVAFALSKMGDNQGDDDRKR